METLKIISTYYKLNDLLTCSYAQLDDMFIKGHQLRDITREAMNIAIDLEEMDEAMERTLEVVYIEKNLEMIEKALNVLAEEMSTVGSIATIWWN